MFYAEFTSEKKNFLIGDGYLILAPHSTHY